MPRQLARGLHALFDGDHQVVALRDKFDRPGVTDAEWIDALGREGGWAVLSGDMRIAKKRPSREMFLRAGLVGFFPLPAVLALPLTRQAARVLTVWPALVDLRRVTERGVYELGISGRVRQIG